MDNQALADSLLQLPKLDDATLRVVPLGGLGEVGRNMAVLEYNSKLLIIDCGVLFPENDQPGVDVILPDFDYIANRIDDVVAIILTHGHEDHIGGVPYLLRLRNDIPIIGSQLTIAFIEAKLKEHRIVPYTLTVKEGVTEQLLDFECEFVAVNHSIPDALAVAVFTPGGSVLHTGDFKMDQLPLDGRITDLRAFARLGERGIDLFMVDSTNAEVPGFVTPEREIGPVIDGVFAAAKGKIVVASFASHVHRVQQVLDAAVNHNRKVVFVGRSMVRNMAIAQDLGYLRVPDGVIVDLNQADKLAEDKVVYMCTGSQGEPMAALSRISANTHNKISVAEGDTVIFASSLIPGNESAIYRVINDLTVRGARVVHSGNAKVHVSGHASAGELLYCYNILRPKNVLPVHGEYRHLLANAAIARSSGIANENVVVAIDGDVIDVKNGVAKKVGTVECGYVYVDGSSVGKLTETELETRVTLGQEGFIAVTAVIDFRRAELAADPIITSRGVAEDQGVLDSILPKVTQAITDSLLQPDVTELQLQQVLRKTVGRWAGLKLRRKPMIIPTVIAVRND